MTEKKYQKYIHGHLKGANSAQRLGSYSARRYTMEKRILRELGPAKGSERGSERVGYVVNPLNAPDALYVRSQGRKLRYMAPSLVADAMDEAAPDAVAHQRYVREAASATHMSLACAWKPPEAPPLAVAPDPAVAHAIAHASAWLCPSCHRIVPLDEGRFQYHFRAGVLPAECDRSYQAVIP